MGIFSWAFKSVPNERKRKQPKIEDVAPEPIAVEEPQIAQPLTERQIASTVLFGEQPVQQEYNSAINHSPYVQTSYEQPVGFSAAFNGNTYGNRNILIVVPKTVADTTNIVTHLRTGEACIVNLMGLPTEDAQRRLDFLSGVVCAINGTIKAIDENKYILTPNGVGVKQ